MFADKTTRLLDLANCAKAIRIAHRAVVSQPKFVQLDSVRANVQTEAALYLSELRLLFFSFAVRVAPNRSWRVNWFGLEVEEGRTSIPAYWWGFAKRSRSVSKVSNHKKRGPACVEESTLDRRCDAVEWSN